MADPFQDVDAAGDAFIASFADSMEARQSDPQMEQIVADYLSRLDFAAGSLTVEVGCGAGSVTKRVAHHAAPEKVIGFDPSAGFIQQARQRVTGLPNLTFAQANGAALPLEDGTADHLILHTVLSHVEPPAPLLAEAFRVLRPGGHLVVCDADFSKASLGRGAHDPLDVCAKAFVREFVTDPFIASKLQSLSIDAGFVVRDFGVRGRTIMDNAQMLPWVEATGQNMLDRGEIGAPLLQGLIAEYHRRAEAGQLYGFQVFATLLAQKPY